MMNRLILTLSLLFSHSLYGDCVNEPIPPPIPKPEPKPQPSSEWTEVKDTLGKYCGYAGCHDGNTKDNRYLLEESLFLTTGIRNIYKTGSKKMPPERSKNYQEYLDKGWIVLHKYGLQHECDELECRK